MRRLLSAILLIASLGAAQAAELPQRLARQLPPGYAVLGTARASFGNPSHTYYMVALGREGEGASAHGLASAPARPLLLFEQRPDGAFLPAGQNDAVILRADEGGQCDPFLDGDRMIAVRGRTFTVQNGVACGSHWTDSVTFRFDNGLGRHVFDNERFQSWSLNSGTDPNAEALVSDGPARVRRGSTRKPVLFENWRRSR